MRPGRPAFLLVVVVVVVRGDKDHAWLALSLYISISRREDRCVIGHGYVGFGGGVRAGAH